MHLFWISGCAACTLLMATDGPQIDWPLNILVQEHYWETRKLGIQSNKPFPFLLFILLYSPSEGWFTIAPWIVDGMVYHCGSLIYDPQAWEMTLCEPRPVGSAQLAVETTAWRNVLMLQAEILGLECHLLKSQCWLDWMQSKTTECTLDLVRNEMTKHWNKTDSFLELNKSFLLFIRSDKDCNYK